MDIIKENEFIHDKIAKKYNSKHLEIYNPIEQNRIGSVIDELFNLIHDKNNIKILDYGSGTGNLTKFFLEKKCKVYSLDISSESLKILKKIYGENNINLKTQKFNGYNIPFEDGYFDIVATYSVLHHIPDYLKAMSDMLRVIKIGGYIYIDHEHNDNHWNPNKDLENYTNIYNSFLSKLKKIFYTKEIFEFDFWKGIFIRKFINPKYVNEGDIHVWKEDHIEWMKIINYLENNGFEIVKNVDYLQYHPFVKIEHYNNIKTKITNTKYIIAKKIN